MGRLQGKVAIVTGAARGMGAAHARRFAAEGAKVLLTDLLDEEGKRVAQEIGAAALYAHLDVRSEEDWAAAVAMAVEQFGRLDILINNSGIQRMATIAEMSLNDFQTVLDVNLTGTFIGLRAAIRPMQDAGGGSIVNIASIAGLVGTAGGATYAASKHAVIGLTKVAAMELGAAGIRVNAVCPGPVDTPLTQSLNEDAGFDAIALLAKKIPLQRSAQPEEITNLVTFLASDESSYCTGSAFVADGGLIAGVGFD
jgi:3alpha(or 20beta)-hydroxysteroid dehydrogenase